MAIREDHNRFKDIIRGRIKENFKKSMILAFKIFGDDAFRKRFNKNDKRKPISKAIFDTLSVNFALLNDIERELLLIKKNTFKTTLIKELNKDNAFSLSSNDLSMYPLASPCL